MDKKRAWFIAILFFSGLCLTLYPFVSNLIAQSHASQAIAAYDEQVAEMDQEQIDAAKEAVRKYNEQLNAAVEASAMHLRQFSPMVPCYPFFQMARSDSRIKLQLQELLRAGSRLQTYCKIHPIHSTIQSHLEESYVLCC